MSSDPERVLRGPGAPGDPPLSASKRALLDLLLKEREQEGARGLSQERSEIGLAPESRYAPFPLTELQQAYWIARTGGFDLGDISVHCYQELDAVGLDAARLGGAWRRVIERHDMLRAVVLPDGRQRVLESVPPYELGLVDLSSLDLATQESELASMRSRLIGQPFSGHRWPLFTVCLSLRTGGRIRAHFAFDGLVLDGWSYRLLFRDLVDFYRDPEATLPRLALTFRDYVLHERRMHVEDPGVARSREAWQERVGGLPSPPALPRSRGSGRLAHPGFVRRHFALEAGAWRGLKQLCAEAGLTGTGLVLAAFAEVVALWSASPRFTLSLPRFNRLPLHPEVRKVVGEFASFSLVGIDYSLRQPFRERARKVQEELWWILQHDRVDGVELARLYARAHDLQGEMAVAPVVFTSMLGLADQDASAPLFELGEVVHRVTQTPQVWLDCLVQEHGGELRCDWDVVSGIFPPGVADAMCLAMERLLLDLAQRGAAWEEEGRMPLPADQLELLEALEATSAPWPEELTMGLIRRQAAERPDATAVLFPGGELTYGSLLARASSWAAILKARGVGPGQVVALVLEKGWEQVLGVVAVLQAGAAFLPIDPGLPAARLRTILETSEASLALTQEWLEPALPWPAGLQRLSLSRDPGPCGEVCDDAGQRPDDLAYVLFTSGSTGRPKGAMISHQGLANALAATLRRFSIGREDRVLALTALHHDMSLFDLLGTLAAGGVIVMPERTRARDPQHWLELLLEHRITIWNSVPAMLEMLTEYARGRPQVELPALRLAFLGGDWIPLSLPQRLRDLAPAVQPVSVGGPTETTLWNIWYPIGAVDPEWKSIPYGRPIANNRYSVRSETLDPCPVWVPGQLCCAGLGLALGYWNDPEAELRAFVRCPSTGERLYRTGDLGRLLPDGNIEILGRVDLQVKLHGQRIELGEIEAALQGHPLVTSAAVVASGERHELRLVAHVVLNRDAAGEGAEFKLSQPGLRRDAGSGGLVLPGSGGAPGSPSDYLARRSYRRYQESPLPLSRLGELLSNLRATSVLGSPVAKRLYPSAGGLYSVAVYLEAKRGRIAGLEAGIHLYRPLEHDLVLASVETGVSAGSHLAKNREAYEAAAFALYLIADLEPLTQSYGDQAEPFALLEAGAIGQLLMSAGSSIEIGLCPIGQLDCAGLRSHLRLRERQRVLHSFVGGTITREQQSASALLAEASRGAANAASELRARLRALLPEHMVPTQWRFPAALPLSANGKVDRLALARQAAAVPSQVHPIAPRSESERTIQGIWRELLNGVDPGLDENFFDLGGSSLQLVQVHRKLADAFGKAVSLVTLFRRPTIRGLAELLLETEPSTLPQGDLDERSARQRLALAGRRPVSVQNTEEVRS
jgi:epothilone synthetase B